MPIRNPAPRCPSDDYLRAYERRDEYSRPYEAEMRQTDATDWKNGLVRRAGCHDRANAAGRDRVIVERSTTLPPTQLSEVECYRCTGKIAIEGDGSLSAGNETALVSIVISRYS